ncbi:MAG: lipopolysaccharide biosynthesis protein [Deltaproteobacteria bacterium]|nr:lipopolysaccharide biosynthesis protein [Deltaproteobacteria bacterium]
MNISEKVRYLFQFLGGEDGSLQKKTIRSVSWVGITGILTNILLFIKGIILARLLTPEIFGLMSICLVVIRAFDIFTETGFYTALIQRQKSYDEAKDTAFTLMIIRGIILAIITFLVSPLVADYYRKDILYTGLKVIALSFIFSGFSNVNTVTMQKDLNFKRLSYLEQIMGIVNFVIVISLAYYFRNVWALVIGHVVASFVGTVLSFVIVPGKLRLRLNGEIAKELVQYGKYITGLSVVVFVTIEINSVIIGKMMGMDALGYYVLAFTLANLPATHISKIISRVLFPAYSKLQDNLVGLQEAFLRTLKLVSYITIPATSGLAVLAPEIVRFVYGDKWTPAVDSLIILSLFGCIRSLGSIQGYLYNAVGKPNISFYLNTAKLILILMISFPLIRRYELIGASLAITIPIAIQYMVELYILGKVIEIKLVRIFNVLFVTSLYSGIMCLVIVLVKKSFPLVNVIGLVFLVIFGVFVYFLLIRRQILSNIQELRTQNY